MRSESSGATFSRALCVCAEPAVDCAGLPSRVACTGGVEVHPLWLLLKRDPSVCMLSMRAAVLVAPVMERPAAGNAWVADGGFVPEA